MELGAIAAKVRFRGFVTAALLAVAAPNFLLAASSGPSVSELRTRTRDRAARLSASPAAGEASTDYLLATGKRQLARGEFARAAATLREAVAHYRGKPAEPAAWLALGQAYAAQKERTRAIEALDTVCSRFPASDLADDAQFEKALLETAELPAPADFMEAIRDFATFNPLSLDPDAIHHLLGVERGYRLDRIGEAIAELHDTWKRYPAGGRAPEALLRLAVIEGFTISSRPAALARLATLVEHYPTAAELPRALVIRGFLHVLEGDAAAAARSFAAVPAESDVTPHAAFLAGLVRAYMLGELDAARPHFQALARSAHPLWADLGHYHRALLAYAAGEPHATVRRELEAVRKPDPEPGAGADSPSKRIDAWRRTLERTLDRASKCVDDGERRLEAARFWEHAGHRQRAIAELRRIVDGPAASPAVPEARMILGKLLAQEPPTAGEGATILSAAARRQPLQELALEANWRAAMAATSGTTALAEIARSATGWRSRAIAELARRTPAVGSARARFLRDFGQGSASPEEGRRQQRDLADFLADEKRYRPALDLYRKILPDDPAIRLTMVKLAALDAAARLSSTAESGPPTTASATRAVELAAALIKAGERDAAATLLGQAAGGPGGARARVALLTLSLSDGKRDLADLKRVNDLLDEKTLEARDRHVLLEWKASILEAQKVDLEKAVDIYRYLVAHGHDADRISIDLARRAIAAGAYKEALTQVAKVTRTPARDLVEALAYKGLGDAGACRDRLVRLTAADPASAEQQEASAELAAIDSERLRVAVAGLGEPAGGVALDEVLESLVPAALPRMRLALELLAAAPLASPPARPARIDRVIDLCAAGGVEASRLIELHRARLATGSPASPANRIALANTLAAASRAREAYEVLEGLGNEAVLEQARLLKQSLGDPARGERRLRELVKAASTSPAARARAAAMLASWRRGEADEPSLLELSAAAQPDSTEAASAWERLGELAATRGDTAGAGRFLEKAARVSKDAVIAGELRLRAAQQFLAAERMEDAMRLATPLLAAGAERDLPARAREVLGVVAGRQQIQALERSLDREDPEAAANAATLLAIARAQVGMQRDFDGAEATLLALGEQFPERAATEDVAVMRRAIARGRSLARLEQDGSRELLRAGLMREEGGEWREAALDYRKALRASRETGAVALLARLYLARLLALRLGEPSRARELVAAAAAQPEASLYGAMIATARAYAAEGSALGAGRAYNDPVQLEGTLRALPAGRVSEMALQAARGLDPVACVTPLGPGAGELLERAVSSAPAGRAKARCWLELAAWRQEEGDPEAAGACYLRAEREAPGSDLAAEAASRRGEMLERDFADAASAAEAYRASLAVKGVKGAFQDVAAARLPIVLARREADAAETDVAPGGDSSDPARLLTAARRQTKAAGQLDRAIENYKAFIRVGHDPVTLDAAYREVAEALVRADRPRDAVELLARLLDLRFKSTAAVKVVLRIAEILETGLADLPEAKRFYEEVRRLAPDGPEAGVAAAGLGRVAAAARAGQRAETAGAAEPASGEELEAIRKKYLGAAKDPAGAAEALVAQIGVTRDRGEQAKLYLELAKIREVDLTDYPAAVDAYSKAIGLLGRSDTAAEQTLRLATVISEKLKQPKKAMEIYDAWLRDYYANPKKVAVMLERARLMETALDNVQVAIDTYRNIANGHPRSGYDEKALLRIAHLSRSYFADHRGAVDAYDQIARRFPFGPNAQTALLQAAQVSEIELGDLNRAVAFYNRLVATYPTSPLAAEARGALARIERRRR